MSHSCLDIYRPWNRETRTPWNLQVFTACSEDIYTLLLAPSSKIYLLIDVKPDMELSQMHIFSFFGKKKAVFAFMKMFGFKSNGGKSREKGIKLVF